MNNITVVGAPVPVAVADAAAAGQAGVVATAKIDALIQAVAELRAFWATAQRGERPPAALHQRIRELAGPVAGDPRNPDEVRHNKRAHANGRRGTSGKFG